MVAHITATKRDRATPASNVQQHPHIAVLRDTLAFALALIASTALLQMHIQHNFIRFDVKTYWHKPSRLYWDGHRGRRIQTTQPSR
jgi:hypothetical protein